MNNHAARSDISFIMLMFKSSKIVKLNYDILAVFKICRIYKL